MYPYPVGFKITCSYLLLARVIIMEGYLDNDPKTLTFLGLHVRSNGLHLKNFF